MLNARNKTTATNLIAAVVSTPDFQVRFSSDFQNPFKNPFHKYQDEGLALISLLQSSEIRSKSLLENLREN